MARASSSSARVLTDHDEIRNRAEERGATPACVKRTGEDGDVGMIRLDFPGYSGEGSLEPIDWDEWLQKFDERNLALLVQDKTASGEPSNFNKLVSRDTVEQEQSARSTGSRAGSRSGGRSPRSTTRKARSSANRRSRTVRAGAASRGSRASGRISQRSGLPVQGEQAEPGPAAVRKFAAKNQHCQPFDEKKSGVILLGSGPQAATTWPLGISRPKVAVSTKTPGLMFFGPKKSNL